jgi:serine protease Do
MIGLQASLSGEGLYIRRGRQLPDAQMLLPIASAYTWAMTLSQTSSSVLATLSDELADTVQRIGRSVVAVHGRRRFPASGLAWSADQVLTAAHVLERDSDLSITDPDGTSRPARLLARDTGSDLAILGVPDAKLQPSPLGSTLPAAGHLVLAVGRPGTPAPIASFGAVTSSGGAWRTATGGILDTYLRADVAMLPGLSGGVLADTRGEVIGLISAHLAGGDPVAIPAASLPGLVQHMLSGGTSSRAYLGVSTQPVELQAGLRDRLHVEQSSGLMLLGLEPDAPAETAGLLLGDILLTIGSRPVEDGEALHMALGPQAVGVPTSVRIIRGGELREVTITPAARPN